jgi:hypothetical protein
MNQSHQSKIDKKIKYANSHVFVIIAIISYREQFASSKKIKRNKYKK